jgi:hypothetical protein
VNTKTKQTKASNHETHETGWIAEWTALESVSVLEDRAGTLTGCKMAKG